MKIAVEINFIDALSTRDFCSSSAYMTYQVRQNLRDLFKFLAHQKQLFLAPETHLRLFNRIPIAVISYG